jgi:hypothetical protein
MGEVITRRQVLAGGLGATLAGTAAVAVADDKRPDPGKKDAKSAGAETELVYRIDKIELEGTGSPPVHYLIKVTGSVLRKDYKNPMLVIKSTTPDAQGTLTYYFAAEPPVGGSPGEAVPIEGKRYLFELQKVKKITVVGATNEMSKNL